MRSWLAAGVLLCLLPGFLPARASAQGFRPGAPPAVGVEPVGQRPFTESSEFIGRVQAEHRVSLVARVTGVLEQRAFVEGSEVTKGALLYVLEQGPYQADLQAKQAAVAQQSALLANATITLRRAQSLMGTPAGQASAVDDALAQQRSLAAQVMAAQAQLKVSQINLGYTEIHAPISGKIGISAISVGNVVSPTSGPLDVIVSQNPMYVVFSVPVRTELDLAHHYAAQGGLSAAAVKLRLEDGSLYGLSGKIDYVAPSIDQNTDTVQLRATIANPRAPGGTASALSARRLSDGEFVTVLVQGVAPVSLLAVPRAAVLEDQQGYYVFVVGADKHAERRAVTLGQTNAAIASITGGLKAGEMVVTDGLQRVRPGELVTPVPAKAGAPGAMPGAKPGASPPKTAPTGAKG